MSTTRLEEARALWALAVERMEDLGIQLESLPNDGDASVRETLEERFNEAEAEADKRRHDFQRAERINQVRSIAGTGATEEQEQNGDGGEERRDISDIRRERPEIRVRVGKEEQTYRKDNSNGNFFFRDLYYASKGTDKGAQDRLQRNHREIQVEKRALSSTDGAGGDFISPLYEVDQWINVVRMGRPYANAIGSRPLPENTDSIIWPKVSTGSAVAAQADVGAVQSTDPTTTVVTVPVKTVAGQVDISQQALDRSMPGLDQVLFADLRADYNLRLDLQCLIGSGSGANAKGVLSDSSRTQITYTDASPTVGEFYSKVMDATQRILAARGLPADTIVMAPRRWAWIMAATDSTGRPLVVPTGPALNSPGTGGIVDLGQMGMFGGLNVVVDANLPATQGAGTNEDVVIVLRAADQVLLERPNPVTRAHDQVLDANLEVRLQLFNYYAYSSERFSPSAASISGTGLVSPAF